MRITYRNNEIELIDYSDGYRAGCNNFNGKKSIFIAT